MSRAALHNTFWDQQFGCMGQGLGFAKATELGSLRAFASAILNCWMKPHWMALWRAFEPFAEAVGAKFLTQYENFWKIDTEALTAIDRRIRCQRFDFPV